MVWVWRHAVNTSLYAPRRLPASEGLQTQTILSWSFRAAIRLSGFEGFKMLDILSFGAQPNGCADGQRKFEDRL